MIETSAHQLSSLATAIFLVGAMLTPIVIANEIRISEIRDSLEIDAILFCFKSYYLGVNIPEKSDCRLLAIKWKNQGFIMC